MIFERGSVSKTITALAIMRLRDQVRLVLDAPAAAYLPQLSAVAAPTTDSPPITVRHLLTMTSRVGYDDQWAASPTAKATRDSMRSSAAYLARSRAESYGLGWVQHTTCLAEA
ncbi:MAG TPA: serine hydrolase domain-containing protein, partial [Polyangiaceae bacterium]|nr:serine hydrolase domain-containing protein [Polyangiaceae bacterium]